jgi:predicted MPP superfamily phosphohydrolase
MITVIGDVHGTTYWKDIVKEYKKEDSDVVVFLGDYLDDYYKTPNECLENLMNIFEYRRFTPNVHMLVGNHDYHYMDHSIQKYSGYNDKFSKVYNSVINDNYALLELTYTFELNNYKYVCSHAGISNTFLNDNNTDVENINRLWSGKPKVFEFKQGTGDYYGNHKSQGPLWIRPEALLGDNVKGYKQIVGHTNFNNVVTLQPKTNIEDTVTVVCTHDAYNFTVLHN